ncbi:hypothetical protein PWG14_28800 [Chromobacterium amazonense]|uniref:hypothetical protein n=1 Tax=Chromobacterium amazonense TaxID=1382803 RepID=UPI00237ECF84|nr:hypothetical protein [Chromobacterium amazonense]MDE1716469.1 hypothetical protein [Chromobacterium amazonense]
MLLFLDTEYTGQSQTAPLLISLALVAEDGRSEWYAELTDNWEDEDCTGFVRREVLPHLHGPRMTWAEAQTSLQAWMASSPRHCIAACDAVQDFQFLLQLLGKRPENLDPKRLDLAPLISTGVYHHAVEKYHSKPGHPWHHALHDARSYRLGWLAYQATSAKNKQK